MNILLTGGRAPVTLDLARCFAAAGHRVVVADSLPSQLCIWSRAVARTVQLPSPRSQLSAYLDALVNIVQAEKIDWLIPTCEEIFYIAYGLPRLTKFCQVLAEPLAQLEQLHNKWTFIETIAHLGLPTPKTILVRSLPDLEQTLDQVSQASSNSASIPALAPSRAQKVVLKPVYSRFASRVKILSLPIPALPQIDIRADYPWVVQQFIEGQQYCLYGVAHEGQLRAYGAYPVSFTADAGSCIYFEAIDHPSLLAWMQQVVTALNFTGQIAFDVIETEAGIIYPLECNPRAISAIHLFRATDRLDGAFFNQGIDLIQPQVGQRRMIGLAMVLYGLPKALKAQQLSAWVSAFWGTPDVLFRWTDPGPFWGVLPLLWQFWQISRATGQSLQQASTRDIEWDGEPLGQKDDD